MRTTRSFAIAGTGSLAVRLPSVVAMAGAVALLAGFVDRLAGRTVALLTGVALLAMPSVVRFGQDARPYALALLLSTVVVVTWWRGVYERRRRDAVSCALAIVGACLMHVYALSMVAVVLAAALSLPADRRGDALRRTALPGATAVLVLVPFLVYVGGHASGQPGVPKVGPVAVARVAAYLPVALLHAPLAPVFSGLVFLLALAGVVMGDRGPLVRLAVGWTLLPPILLVLLQTATGRPGLVARYWGVATPGLAVLIALGLTELARRRRVAVAVAVGVVTLATTIPAQAELHRADGHGGKRYVLLADALRRPSLADFPLLISASVSRTLYADAPALASTRVAAAPTATADGLLAAPPLSPRDPRLLAAAGPAGGFLAYRPVFTGVSRIPTRGSFASLVPRSTPDVHLVLRCDYFGDDLGLFAIGSAVLPVHAIAADLRAVAGRNVRCRLG
jgi:hypothetical protein